MFQVVMTMTMRLVVEGDKDCHFVNINLKREEKK